MLKCNTGPAPRRAPFGGNRRWGVPGRLGERRNGKVLAVAALALVMAAGFLAAQPGGWIGAPSGDGGAAVPDVWPPSSDAAFAGLLPGYVFAQSVALNLTATDSITDGGALVLDGAESIATFESSGSTYAAIASSVDNGVQILDITDPSAITAAGNIGDTAALELDGAWGITTFESGGSTYAAVAAFVDGGIQILDITDPSAITAAGNIGDTAALELDGASGITTFESGGSTYAAVAAYFDDGVQILDITDPSDITAAGSITDTDALVLDGAGSIATFESGGSTYAAVASSFDGGVQILDITDPSDITAAGSITDTDALELNGAYGITTFESGGSTYAAVAAYNDAGVQILDVTDPSAITAAGSITDGGILKLYGAEGITTFESGGSTYAAVASFSDDGVQILDVTDPSDITAAGSIGDTAALELDGASGITTFESGGSTYAAVASLRDDGVQILRLTGAGGPPTANAGPDQTADVGDAVTLNGTGSSDPDGDPLEFSWAQTSGPGVTLSDAAAESPTFEAPAVTGQAMLDFTLTVTAGGESDTVTITVTVSEVNAPPVLAAIPSQAVNELSTLTFTATATDADVPADTLTFGLSGAPGGATISPSTGAFAWTPAEAQGPGTHTFDVTVSDGNGGTDSRPVTVTVSEVNAPPVLAAIPPQAVDELSALAFAATATDADVPTDTLTFGLSGAPGGATISPSTGAFAWTPAENQDGSHTVTVTVSDGNGGTDAQAVTIRVNDSISLSSFVTTWQTTTTGESITIPVDGATGTYTIDWGDENTSVDVSGDQTHTYDAAGTYTVSISGDFTRILLSGSSANAQKLQSIEQWGDTQWRSMSGAFRGASSMTYNAADAPDLSRVTDMSGMFDGASSFNGDLSSWDVSKVTDMRLMFDGASSFNGDLSSWDVSKVTDMRLMFDGASSFNGDLSSWDVSGVTDMRLMFDGASSFSSDLSSWDVSGVTDMRLMFDGASSFSSDLSSWDVSKVTDMRLMFDGASSFRQNLGKWYIVLNSTSIGDGDAARAVGWISAQNEELDGQDLEYGIGTGGDSDSFEIADGAILRLKAAPDHPTKSSYTVDITSTGDFGTGNVRTFDISVTGGANGTSPVSDPTDEGGVPEANNAPVADAGADQTVQEGSTVTLSGTATDDDSDDLTYSWTHDSSLAIQFANSTSPSTTFTAPAVDADTTVTFTLTVSDGTTTASGSSDITITDSGTAPIEPPVTPPDPRDIGEIILTSTQPGAIQVTWQAPGETPKDYRVAWAKVGEPFLTWTNLAGNAFPTSPDHTITDLEEGEQYKVRTRARYDSGGSGDWSGVATITVARTV